MKIVIFGLAITSSWGNGHATTYRSLCRALHQRGHRIVFFEHDAEWYANNRDIPEPPYCKVVNYVDWPSVRISARRELADGDVAIVGSYFPHSQEATEEIFASNVAVKAFYDIDTPVTLSCLRETGHTTYLRSQDLPGFDIYFSFTGGPALDELEQKFGVRKAIPLYCSVDTERYRPLPLDPDFACDVSYMGTYAPDRQPKLEELLCKVARERAGKRFIVAGPQYPTSSDWPINVIRLEHLEPKHHPSLYGSSRLVLNLTRRDMVMAGYSPSVRLFEAAACGATIVSDNWPGLSQFFQPGAEILIASSSAEVHRLLNGYSDSELKCIGSAAREKILAEHSSFRRAQQFETYINSVCGPALTAHVGI